jgi:hypothetical protein
MKRTAGWLSLRSLGLPAEQFGAALPTVQDGVAGMQLIDVASVFRL